MIIKCEECEAKISDTATLCPNCGRNRIVNLLPYQMNHFQNICNPWDSVGCNLAQQICSLNIPNCPRLDICNKCWNLKKCIKDYLVSLESLATWVALITFIFLIAAFAFAVACIFL